LTTTYDPGHPAYLDEVDLRQEMARVFEHCHGCRLCFSLCPAFPSLFEMIDARDGDVASMTVAEQDRVVDECYQCKLCYNKCPYVPPHEWELDFPRMMMRAQAVRHERSRLRDRVADQALCRTDLVGRVSTAASLLVNRVNRPGSPARRLMQAGAGIAAERLLPPYARQRFTTWFKRRPASRVEDPRGAVSLFATCFVEYMEPGIGKDIVKVYERNRVECTVAPGTRCCGAPWLHNGDVKRFARQAGRNVAALAMEVRSGREVVVAQPTCAYVIRKDYPIVLHTPDAELVAEHTLDPAEYLMRMRDSLDTDFEGEVPGEVTYHVACHLQAQGIGYRSRDLLKLTGARVNLVAKCSGIDGTWGYKAANYALAREVAQPMREEVEKAGTATVCGDCHLANGAIRQETGAEARHPIQVVARAYGIPEE
jgi:glycerol-3-phosphate dehydrogenase subunit C